MIDGAGEKKYKVLLQTFDVIFPDFWTLILEYWTQ